MHGPARAEPAQLCNRIEGQDRHGAKHDRTTEVEQEHESSERNAGRMIEFAA